MAVSFICGGSRSTWRKPLTCRKSLIKLHHIMLYQVHLAWAGFKLTTLVVIGTDCICNCKFNYHAIMATVAPRQWMSICLDLRTKFLKIGTFWIIFIELVTFRLMNVSTSFFNDVWSCIPDIYKKSCWWCKLIKHYFLLKEFSCAIIVKMAK